MQHALTIIEQRKNIEEASTITHILYNCSGENTARHGLVLNV